MKSDNRNKHPILVLDDPSISASKGSVEDDRRQRFYQTLLSNTPDMIFMFDLDHRFLYANKALLNMWGKSWDEAIGKNCLELGYPAWQAAMHDGEIDQIVATKKSIRGEVPFTGTDGRRIYDYIFVPVIGPDGEVEAVSGTARDVTERREADLEIARLNEKNTKILESITDAFFALDHEWRFIYANKQAEQILGRQRDEVLGKVIWDLYPESKGTEFENVYAGAMYEGVAGSVTSYYPDHDRWYEVHAYPADNGITVYGRNVTESKVSETALRESEKRYEHQANVFNTTLSSMTDFTYTLTKDGKFIYANKPMLEFLEISLEELKGKSFSDLNYPPELVERLMEQIRNVVRTGEIVKDENQFISPAGIEGYYEYIFSPVVSADGSIDVVCGSTRDISDRKKAEQSLLES
ncbi:MAG: PAS domain-containing protein, partial [Pyrinomonadaceae bacterium]